jgi:ribosomal protein S6E (S10)
MATEVVAGTLDEEWEGGVVGISAGRDKHGFPWSKVSWTMAMGLVLSKEHPCYRPRITEERKWESLLGIL